ncbi:MAG: carboxypeptidase-like regulatory domain-containing protein, partial [Armatimonadota bacterium]
MRLKFWLNLTFAAALGFLLFGCGQEDISCLNPNTLSGFVYVRQGAFEETDGTLDDDVLVSDRSQPPTGFLPFKGAKVKVEETGASLELGERGSFVFHPLPAGIYTIVIEFEGFPPVRRTKSVCVVTLPSYYYRPPYYDPFPAP